MQPQPVSPHTSVAVATPTLRQTACRTLGQG